MNRFFKIDELEMEILKFYKEDARLKIEISATVNLAKLHFAEGSNNVQ